MKRSPVKAAIQSMLNRVGYQLVQKHRVDNLMEEIASTTIAANNGIDVLKLIVHEYMKSHPNPFFIQIGANDGMYDDDFRKYITDFSWQGVLVEPQPGPFARLVQNYRGHPGLRFENTAIGLTSGVATLWGFSGTLGDYHLDVFTSFDYDRVAEVKKIWNIQFEIERFDVPTMTFAALLSKYNITELDILVIDTEGYDFEILKMIDFATLMPAIIQFEGTNLMPSEKVACFKMLVEKGYRLGRHHRDIVAYRSER